MSEVPFEPATERFLQNLALAEKEEEAEERKMPKIKVQGTFSTFAFLYEKFRNLLDYQEEHLLLRRAIARILKRRLRNGTPPLELGQLLLSELILARYLPNEKIPQQKTQEINALLLKYQALTTQENRDDLWEMAAAEIEEKLTPHRKLEAVLTLAEAVFVKKDSDDHERALLLEESLLRSDAPTLRYHLFRRLSALWERIEADEVLKIKDTLLAFLRQTDRILSRKKLNEELRGLRHKTAPFLLLFDLLEQRAETLVAVFRQHESFKRVLNETARERYENTHARLKTAAARALVFIFCTKMLLALLLEVPYELWILGQINLAPLFINLIIPPLLMYLLILTIRKPTLENTRLLVSSLESSLYLTSSEPIKPPTRVFLSGRLRKLIGILFELSYWLTLSVILFGTGYFLLRIGFTWVSLLVFYFFASTVAFFAYYIRSGYRRILITEEHEGWPTFLFDVITLPFARLGAVLSAPLAQFNVAVVVLDLIIETPLKTFLEILDEWRGFLRQKKEEISS